MPLITIGGVKMANATFKVPVPQNEPVLSYAPGTPEREQLKKKTAEMKAKTIEIPLRIGGREYKTNDFGECRCPHDHKVILAKYHKASPKLVQRAIDVALKAREKWAQTEPEDRARIFLKTADLLAGPYRQVLNAATMLGQGKNAYQAEIDSACELIDFFRFNAQYMTEIYKNQPESSKGMWNRLEYRPLEGFVLAITPFNFTAIAGNLPSSPALMGNVALWKCASTAVYSAHYLEELFIAAGLPEGVITLLPSASSTVGDVAFRHRMFAGLHFTGSTELFRNLWKTIGDNVPNYHSYPRIVGETGGKDFIFVHKSAETNAVATAMIRGAFEFQGQKCSAASRAYVPACIWLDLRKRLSDEMKKVKTGTPEDYTNFVNAVIDRNAFDSIKGYIDFARKAKDAKIIIGGKCDDSVGYFIEPTIILAKNPKFRTMVEEIFGPVLTIYVYDERRYAQTLELCSRTSMYALTGSIFARDHDAITLAIKVLRDSAGNFYINDKPTGAVVGQQPFGGARGSGTNDKAGSMLNLLRWVSPRTIKETFVPPTDFAYPFMKAP
jgi:1-pyrroline-5-carboxylate dehydrogenase